ncbi:MAG: carbohydrate ABC transporter permease [Anaerolineae bacterium]|nr:carbohydrate ABC transporter permease [Anaerolineae bacterium]
MTTTYATTSTTTQQDVRARKIRKFIVRIFVIYIPVVVVMFFMLLPFYWMLVTSFKPNPELYNRKISPFYPLNPTGEHYQYLFNKTSFMTWFVNTAVVSVVSTLISVALSIPAAYSLARLHFKGRQTLSTIIFIAYLIPTTLLFIPMVEVVKQLDLINKREALMFVYPTFLLPFCIWLLLGYIRTLPADLEECAMVDGATRWQAMIRITLPLAMPGIISAGIFAFTLSWNEFIYSLVLVTSNDLRTIAVGVITQLVAGDLYAWGPLMAAALLGSIPVVILFSFFVEQYVSGLTAGALKG